MNFLILLAVLWNVNFSIHQGVKSNHFLTWKFQHQQLSLQIPEKHNGRGSYQVILLSLARSNFTQVSFVRCRFNLFCKLCALLFVATHISAPLTLQRISTASNVNLSFWNLSSLLTLHGHEEQTLTCSGSFSHTWAILIFLLSHLFCRVHLFSLSSDVLFPACLTTLATLLYCLSSCSLFLQVHLQCCAHELLCLRPQQPVKSSVLSWWFLRVRAVLNTW